MCTLIGSYPDRGAVIKILIVILYHLYVGIYIVPKVNILAEICYYAYFIDLSLSNLEFILKPGPKIT